MNTIIPGSVGDYLHGVYQVLDSDVLKNLKQLNLDSSNVDTENHWQDTLLLGAIRNKLELCVSYLLSIGADPNKIAYGGVTPIDITNDYNIIKLLLDAGAEPEEIILSWCIRDDMKQLACLFIDRGAPFDKLTVPDWVTEFADQRTQTRQAAIIMMGIHKFKRTNVTGPNNRDVICLVAKRIWSFRMGDDAKK
jgi:hypothetical protein